MSKKRREGGPADCVDATEIADHSSNTVGVARHEQPPLDRHHGPALTEFSRDMIVAALDLLSAADLSAAAASSRLLLLLVREVQRKPSIVTEVGLPNDVCSALKRRLAATPTLGFVFGTGDLKDGSLARVLSTSLPPGCHIIGARSQELQALVLDEDPAASPGEALVATPPRATSLRHVAGNRREAGKVTLMLGSFPDAIAQSFFLSLELCSELCGADGDGAALAILQERRLPVGPEWKTIVLIVSSVTMQQRIDPERIVKAFQRGSRSTAVIGGIAEEQILLHSRVHTRVKDSGIVGLALRGDVPLTALVSRGCLPVSRPLRARGARVVNMLAAGGEEAHRLLMIPELLSEEGTSINPLSEVLKIQNEAPRHAPIFLGLRFGGAGGYLLEQLSQENFQQGGEVSVRLEQGELEEGRQAGDPPSECDVRFYQLDAQECKKDLRQLLGYVQQQCTEREEETLGAIMFTCGGRGQRFFKEAFVDAKQFREVFPSLPLVGFWAGGEIGPQAFAEASVAEATRAGRAALQGFTAVFGIFRAPAPKSRTAQVLLSDEELPLAVGGYFKQLAAEAKERGNEAFREGDLQVALTHYTRAVDLALVPSAAVPPGECAALLENRAITRLRNGDAAGGLADADAALELEPAYAKAHYRRAQALIQLQRPTEAAAGLQVACQLLPEDGALKELLSRVREASSG